MWLFPDTLLKGLKKNYGRDSDLIYPPVDCSYFKPGSANENFYLMVSPLAPNKRVDIAVEAFNAIALPLIVIGSGQEEKKIKKKWLVKISNLWDGSQMRQLENTMLIVRH
ncbi:MAG: hypothetical protein SCABRO_00074 [Candidatus Scalindua brodae]|uniref:Uncharacterized protein n=1 Tax=Candidatus Scalindua brodae TaxID=237368 RepID=A0A0B0ENG3_9BACT|nr:MAG: hypothetical protein SCABRO_00074 [Candidatus Scalindua brodae]